MTHTQKKLTAIRIRRIKRTRAKIIGTADRPRLAVFRSNRAIYAQLIDDSAHTTLVGASSRELSLPERKKTMTEQAGLVGKFIAEKARTHGIVKAVLDRRNYKYHGRVKALKEGAEASGLLF